MSEEKLDPDLKMHMSLDQIIRLDKSLNKAFKKKWRRKENLSAYDHSVPLLSSLGGGFIYVTKNSPLLHERRRRLMEAERNRQLNSDLLKMTKKVIPACYHLIKTDTGFEKVLLPIRLNATKRKTRKRKGKAKGNWPQSNQRAQSLRRDSESMVRKDATQSSANDSDDDVVVLYSSIKSQECGKREPMDMEVDSLSSNSVWSNVQCNYFMPQKPIDETLNDRFRSISSERQRSTFSGFKF